MEEIIQKTDSLNIDTKLCLKYINDRINKEVCYNTINKLSNSYLLEEYKKCKSVKKEIFKLSNILEKYVNTENNKNIINQYINNLIPPGTKGVVRGIKFNQIVKTIILDLNLDKNIFDVCFEQKCNSVYTDEIPDWYILNKKNEKIIIGMNQLDLWNGGAQYNRGFKYLDNKLYRNKKIKLLCVVCNYVYVKSYKTKLYNIFNIGFQNNTICYVNNLENSIHKFLLND